MLIKALALATAVPDHGDVCRGGRGRRRTHAATVLPGRRPVLASPLFLDRTQIWPEEDKVGIVTTGLAGYSDIMKPIGYSDIFKMYQLAYQIVITSG